MSYRVLFFVAVNCCTSVWSTQGTAFPSGEMPGQAAVQHSIFWEIRIGDLIMIAAVLAAPFAAVFAQWHLQLRREGRERKMAILKALMANRANAVANARVEALNMIDVEFNSESPSDSEIREAWKIYLEHLNKEQGKSDKPKVINLWSKVVSAPAP
jgi:hypothetical protein